MEPLFLDSPMHEKIWGGNRLKTEFGYDIPSEHTGEYWAISAHPNGVSDVKQVDSNCKVLTVAGTLFSGYPRFKTSRDC